MKDASFTFKVEALNLKYGDRQILSNLNWVWDKGVNCIGVFGKNGAGKSSLFKCMLGLEREYGGTLEFLEESLQNLDTRKRAALGLSGLEQQACLFWDMTVKDNLLAVAEFLKLSPNEQASKVVEVLEKVGLSHLEQQLAKTLSGGEQRRLEIARLLLQPPKLIILDEPFAGLDAMSIQSLLEMMQELMGQGVKIMISDHQINPLLACSDQILWIEEGKVVALESKAEFVQRPEINKLV